jgi:hypothetical protein
MTQTDWLWSAAFIGVGVAVTGAELPVALELLEAQPLWSEIVNLHAATLTLSVGFACLHLPVRLRRRLADIMQRPDVREMDVRRRLSAQAFWAWYLVSASAVFGVLGAGSTVLAYVLYLRHARHARTFEQWYQELFPERGRRVYERVYDDLMLTVRQRQSRAQVIPFSDVMAYGTAQQKQTAISMMSRHFEPSFAIVLKRALDDRNNSVRIQAATAVTNLESRFSERAMALEQQANSEPSPKYLLELARHLDRYAYSELLDGERTQRTRARAVHVYQRYLEVEADDFYARIAIGRLWLREGKYEQARDWLVATRARLGAHPSLDNWLLEAHYRMRDYAAVRTLARTIAQTQVSRAGIDLLSDSTRMWAGFSAAEAPAATP